MLINTDFGKKILRRTTKTWIGIPLWVHRRCLNPMFTIANQIAYTNKMVLPEYMQKPGKEGWYHVTGKVLINNM